MSVKLDQVIMDRVDYDALAARMESSTDYSIKLQQLIENLKYPESEVPSPELHHHKMIVAAKARIRELEAALKEALECAENCGRGWTPEAQMLRAVLPQSETEGDANG